MLDIEVKRVNGAYQLRDKTTGAWFGICVRPDEVEEAKRTCKFTVPFVGEPGEGVLVPLRYGNTVEASHKRKAFERETWETLAPSGVFPYDERYIREIAFLTPHHQKLLREYAEASDMGDEAEWNRHSDVADRLYGLSYRLANQLEAEGVYPKRYKTGIYAYTLAPDYFQRREDR